MKTWIARSVVVAFVLLMGVVAAGFAQESTNANLLDNGSFEELLENGRPVAFGFGVYAGDAKISIDSTVARTGQNSVRIEADPNSRGLVGRSIPVQGGKAYRISLWYRTTENIQHGNVLLRVMAYHNVNAVDANKVTWQSDWLLDPFEGDFQIQGQNFMALNWQDAVNEWREMTVSFKIPEEVVALRIEAFNQRGDGVVWFDDVSLVEIDAGDA